jgi:hypothetical protein
MRRLRAALLAIAVALPAVAQEVPRVFVRPGIHEDFVRVAFNWPRRVAYTVNRDGDVVEIRFEQPGRLDIAALVRRLPRNIEAVEPVAGGLRLRLRPGAEIRHMVVGETVALDVLDDSPGRPRPPARPAAAPEETSARPQASSVAQGSVAAPPLGTPAPRPPVTPTSMVVAPLPASLPPAVPAPPPADPPDVPRRVPELVAQATVARPAAASTAAAPAAPGPVPPALLPFDGGAAAFARGGDLVLVFDRPVRPDLSALRGLHPALAEAEMLEAPGATAIRLPGGAGFGLSAEGGRWVLGPARPAAPIDVTRGAGEAPRLLLSTAGASRALALPDPASSDLLLVGTVMGNAATETGFDLGSLELLPTRLGVVLLRRSDTVEMRRTDAGFAVPLPEAAAVAPPGADLGAAAGLRRILALEDLPQAELAARLRDLSARIASAAPGVRPSLRLDIAEAQLALGLAVEAQATMQAAVHEDPRLSRQPRAILLQGAAAHVAGRASEAEPFLADSRLPLDGEPALWRGMAGVGAAGLREAAPILRAYPAALRARLGPRTVLALVQAGHMPEARALAARLPEFERSGMGRFALARLAEAAGDASAEAAYAALEGDRDPLARSMAMERRAELRLRSGSVTAAQAARDIERAAIAWRGDERELAMRLRAVELRLQAGEPGLALDGLRDARALFPEALPQIQERERQAALASILHEATPTLDAARILAEHHASLPPDPRLVPAMRRIADQLLRLGLTDEATRLLERGMESSQPEQRALLALQLAEARLADGNPAGALADLRRGEGAGALPGEAGLRRAFLEAEARSRTGDIAGATGVLRALGHEGSARLAELLAEAQDWRGAAEALAQHLATAAGGPGPLAATPRRDLLRLAAFHALAEDASALLELRRRYRDRIGDANVIAVFDAITGEVGVERDAASLRREVARARAIAEGLRAVQ